MTEATDSEDNCVNKQQPCQNIAEFNLKKKIKTLLHHFPSWKIDSFYQKEIQNLKSKQGSPDFTTWEQDTICRKKCTHSHGQIFTKDRKQVPNAQLFGILREAHQQLDHRADKKTEK